MDVGEGKGRYYTVNVPLKDGITDKPFVQIFSRYSETLLFVLIVNTWLPMANCRSKQLCHL